MCRQDASDRRRDGYCHAQDGRNRSRQYPQIAIIGLTRELKDDMSYSMEKAGAVKIIDKTSAVAELYDAIQRAVGGIDGKAINLPCLGSMSEAR